MTLDPGTKLGPYEIVSPLGAGGMGEVYRARDVRLGREVAVKVLPQHLSSNPEVRARFEREARTVSGLNHPHICVLHDVGREGDTDYLVMELIEGETLASRLARGPVPLPELVKLGVQIADALDRAHRAGIIHRDLKPGNIMLTRSGAKLMDFGLARATGLAGPGSGSGVTMANTEHSPTMAQPLTAEGSLVGTFQYMSPEQLEGNEADERSDMWSLGCVLYEMATGKRAFEGKSQASLIGAIMNASPAPVSQVSVLASPALDRLVGACLAKDPADRIQSAHDVKLQLGWLAEVSPASSSAVIPPPALPSRKRPRWPALAGVALGAAVVTAAALLAVLRGGGSEEDRGGPERYVLGSANLSVTSSPVLSPDGSTVVFSASEDGVRRLYRRSLSSFEFAPIQGTEEGTAPFFSPDGTWIGFVTPKAVKKVPAGGGVAQVVLAESRVNGGDWGADGTIYYTPMQGGGAVTALARVSAAGGTPEIVAAVDTAAGETEGWLPEVLPGGKWVLITVAGGSASWHVMVVGPEGTKRELVPNAILTRYMPSGHLIYLDMVSQAVLAAPFDPDRAEFTGPAVPLTEAIDPNYGFDVSETGTLVYVPVPGADVGVEVIWLDRSGAATPVFDTRATWTQPRVSPDGKAILLRKTATDCELWKYDLERQSLGRLLQGGDNHDAVWSPDGRRIAFEQANAGGGMLVHTIEGAREVVTLASGSDRGRPQSWSSGGDLLVYTVSGRGTNSDIWTAAMGAGGSLSPFLASPFEETDPAISQDGKWIAYVTDETGSKEVFVRPVPNTGVAYQISAGGGGSPLWSRDGRELYFTAGAKMMAAPIETSPGFRAGKPVLLFDGGFSTNRARDFDVAPDGRFVAVRVPGGTVGQREMRVLLDWPAEMKRLSGD